MSVSSLPLKPAAGTNFEPKRVRKAKRKELIRKRGGLRAILANNIADKRLERKARAQFYRDLRHKKIRRHRIAAEMGKLDADMDTLRREVFRIGERVHGLDTRVYAEAVLMVKAACASTSAAAEEWYEFSRRPIQYGTVG